MRIAWVLYGELTQRTGGTIYDAQVVAGLERAGDDVTVLSLPHPAAAPEQCSRGAQVVGSLAAQVRALAPDVVVGDELCFRELALLFPRLRRSMPTTRRVLLVHHLSRWETELAARRRGALGHLESLAMRSSDTIITTSETTRRRLLAEGATTPIAVVLPGADRLARVARADREGDVRFMFLGAIVPRKRVLELVRAFATGAGAASELVLVGSTTRDEPYVRAVRALIAARGLEARVTLLGEVDEAAAATALASSDVLVMPSSLEGYGIAATEAIHAGVPVIAARARALEEALSPCPDACLFADDAPSLTLAIHRFATDAALRTAMKTAATNARAQLPTWSACAAAFGATLAP